MLSSIFFLILMKQILPHTIGPNIIPTISPALIDPTSLAHHSKLHLFLPFTTSSDP